MRVKQVWNYVPLPEKFRLMWARLTVSRLTTLYFVFSVVHCIIQVILQVQAFSVNKQAADLLSDIIHQGNATVRGFTVLDNDLRLCQNIPKNMNTDSCQVIWAGTPFNASGDPVFSSASSSASAADSASTLAPIATPGNNVAPGTVSIASLTASGTTTATVTVLPTGTPLSAQVAALVSPAPSTFTRTVFVEPTAAPAHLDDRALQKRSVGKLQPVNVDGETRVILNGLGYNHQPLELSRKCLLTLNWPTMTLEDTKREDITFIGFQFWLLGMSIVAILNESIPHILVSLFVHVVATGWSAWQMAHTTRIKADFNRLTTDGACGHDFLRSYWQARSNAEIPSMALNVAGLLVSIFLTWRLVKLFGWQTFKRIGASITVNRVYKVVLSLSIVIQLALFFVVVSMALWIDQLCNGYIAKHAEARTLYITMISITCVLMVPWLALGWTAVRREHRGMMIVFLGMSVLYIVGWGAMFDSVTFRWTFATWRFFRVMTVAGAVLTALTLVLGVICRINFGKGLPQFLNAKEPLPGDDFTPAIERRADDPEAGEKVAFPSMSAPMPTFSAAYGAGGKPVPPGQMRFGTPGPRVQTTYDRAPGDLSAPASAHTRSPVSPATSVRATVRRQDSLASVHSTQSGRSVDSQGKRWVIE